MGIGVLRFNLKFQLMEGMTERDAWWRNYWKDGHQEAASSPPRIVRIPDDPPGLKLPHPHRDGIRLEEGIRDAIARLKDARANESKNRNLSSLLAVVGKVTKDLEYLVGEK